MVCFAKWRAWVVLIAVAAAFWAAPAGAAQSIKITPEIRADLERVGKYLDAITTMQSDFLQISSTGDTAEGTLYLDRPKRLRVEYKPPTPVLIVANGSYLSYVDTDLQQVQHIALEDTPVAFLLRANFSFTSDDIIVTGFEKAANAIRVSMEQKRDPLAGELTLVFSDEPTVLRKWVVVDAQGVVTNVTLINPRFGFNLPEISFDPPLFLKN